MDYSFLIGLHFRDDYSSDEMKSSPNESCSGMCLLASSYFHVSFHVNLLDPRVKRSVELWFLQARETCKMMTRRT